MTSTIPYTGRRELAPGATLGGRYRIEAKLGEGGMASVYRATHLSSGAAVALKLLLPHLAGDAVVVERFRREALAASAIGHPGIVEVRESGELEGGTVFIAMELLEGRSLGAILQAEGPLPVGRVARIARELALALEAAHAKGIVHRDLKPENVMLLEGDRVKVLDFGISKLLSAVVGVEGPSPTRTGTTLGTPHYMAPEQAQALKDVDHRVDVYALGVILFRLLSGQHPFDDESLPVLIVKICVDAPPPLARWRGDVPQELAAVIARMLEKERELRFSSMREVHDALEPFESSTVEPWLLGGPSTRTEKASALSQRPRVDPEGETPVAQRAPERTPTQRPPAHDEPRESHGEAARESALPAGVAPPARAPLLVAAAGVFAVLAGLLAYAAIERDPRVPDEAAMAPLPTPREPRARPMVAPRRDGVGWTWLNPLPRAMPTWYAVDAASGGDPVVLVGRGGAAVRYADGELVSWRTGTEHDLRGVAWTGAREALAVGEAGTLVRLTLEGPRALDAGTHAVLRDVVAVSATEALVVGDAGTVLRVQGERVSRVDVGTRTDLLAVFARGEQLFVVGAEGMVLRIEGATATRERSGVSASLRGVGGCARGGVYAAGDQGALLRRRSDGAWEALRVEGNEAFTALSCDHGRVAAARRDGRLLLVSGVEVRELPSGFEGAWYGVAGGAQGPSWLVGAGGRLATIEQDHVRTRTAGPTAPIRALGSMGGALVAVGEWGRILREREDGIAQVDSPTEYGLGGLVQIDEGRLLAVGDFGALVDIRYDRASLVESPTEVSLRAGVAAADELLLVGARGTLVRGNLGVMRSSAVDGAGDLWSVAGTPRDAIAVGDEGIVLRVDAERALRLPCEGGLLRAVTRTNEGAWAVGDGGRVIRIEDAGCVEEHRGRHALHAVGVGPEGRLIAVGDEGTILTRSAEGRWVDTSIDSGRASLRAVLRGDREVFVAGTDGVLLRHPRIDGE